jgi:hypothetical protein
MKKFAFQKWLYFTNHELYKVLKTGEFDAENEDHRYWVDCFDVKHIRTFGTLLKQLPSTCEKFTMIKPLETKHQLQLLLDYAPAHVTLKVSVRLGRGHVEVGPRDHLILDIFDTPSFSFISSFFKVKKLEIDCFGVEIIDAFLAHPECQVEDVTLRIYSAHFFQKRRIVWPSVKHFRFHLIGECHEFPGLISFFNRNPQLETFSPPCNLALTLEMFSTLQKIWNRFHILRWMQFFNTWRLPFMQKGRHPDVMFGRVFHMSECLSISIELYSFTMKRCQDAISMNQKFILFFCKK